MVEKYISVLLGIEVYKAFQQDTSCVNGVKEFLGISSTPGKDISASGSHSRFCHTTHFQLPRNSTAQSTLEHDCEKHDCLVAKLLWKFPLTCRVTRSLQSVARRP